jgi:hypothetical protein
MTQEATGHGRIRDQERKNIPAQLKFQKPLKRGVGADATLELEGRVHAYRFWFHVDTIYRVLRTVISV